MYCAQGCDDDGEGDGRGLVWFVGIEGPDAILDRHFDWYRERDAAEVR